MKKIVAALDGLKYAESTTRYAIDLSKQIQAHLVGVFMDDRTYNSYKIYEIINQEGLSDSGMRKLEKKDADTRTQSTVSFEKACRDAGLDYTVHHDRNIAIQEIKHESIYADLLVIDARETLTHYTEKPPTRFVRDLLGDAQCPVLVVPPKYKPIGRVVLLFDGEPSSVHAIKMFSYLFPEHASMEVEIISVNPVNSTLHLKDNKLMKEFMKRHFPKATYTVLKGLAEEEIVRKLKEQPAHSLIVLGAYRRTSISRWFRESMADLLMRELKLPLFIAHNK
jgi:hypothetical protein